MMMTMTMTTMTMMMLMMVVVISAIQIYPYFVPGTVLSSWHIIIHLNHAIILEKNIINIPIFRCGT